ncbi:hypothetical protein TNCV_1735211 [Trichonephila clavipes]|nr:hypothetical protein TNCV_1735211 [Trichonephila clavipes]
MHSCGHSSTAAGGYNFAFRITLITFVCLKTRKRSKTIAFNEDTSTTVGDTVTALGVGKSSVSRILRTFQDPRTSSLKKGENVGASGKLPQVLIKF